ncbi:DUF4198 domain-containing protein [bacterium]|nr:DUF4198 domain-containing protein [bacterium]
MSRLRTLSLAALLLAPAAWAHFGMIIPSDSMVMMEDNRTLALTLSFSHPCEAEGMEMARPAAFGVIADGSRLDLSATLQPTQVLGHAGWKAEYAVKRPGVLTFFMSPQPYWEPAEDCFIVHHTKSVVAAFGEEEGWNQPVGLPLEIVPLTRPFGLYAGNVFSGVVLKDGKPLAGAPVEVEYYNRDGRLSPPNDYFITQTVLTDERGAFHYSPPAAGWWGFAALVEDEKTMPREGQEKSVELGGVLWVEFTAWPGP